MVMAVLVKQLMVEQSSSQAVNLSSSQAVVATLAMVMAVLVKQSVVIVSPAFMWHH